MSIYVKNILIKNFRNIEERCINFCNNINIIVGNNATGKTNTIEALHIITTSKSIRDITNEEIIQNGYEKAFLDGKIRGDGREIDINVLISLDKTLYFYNNKRCKSSFISGLLPTVTFTPDDLLIVKGSSHIRRKTLDSFACQISEGYKYIYNAYNKIIKQRNKILKSNINNEDVLQSWNRSLIEYGSRIIFHRIGLLKQLQPYFMNCYQRFVGRECFSYEYKSTLGKIDCHDLDSIRCIFESVLDEVKHEEIKNKVTLVGPHRDDIILLIDKEPVRAYASQSQQRSVVLAWKIAEVEFINNLLNVRPLLLLDDVMSEFDKTCREKISAFIGNKAQTVITSTEKDIFSHGLLLESEVIVYE